MADLSNIVTVNVTANVLGLQQPGFGIPNILGNSSSAIAKGGFQIFTNMNGVSAVFSSSDPEWLMANAIFSQNPAPQEVFISRELDRVAQVDTIVFSANIIAGDTIHGEINNTVITVPFNTTNAQTLTDLATALTIVGISSAVSDGVHTVTVTSAVAGITFTLTAWNVTGPGSPATVTITNTVANVGFAESLASVANVDSSWYGVLWTERTAADVAYAFTVIEGTKYMFITASNDTDCYDPLSTTDIMALCQAGNYQRSAVMYSGTANTQYADAAWMGINFPKAPGSENWAFNNLAGITADNLTQSQYTAITNKNGNCFVPFANTFGTWKGWTGGGLYLDFRRGIDWTISEMQVNIAQVILQPTTGNKVPYTDQGVAALEQPMYFVLQQGALNQFIVGGLRTNSNPFGYLVTSVPVADESPADIAARYYPDLGFSAYFTNAIDTVLVNGTLSLQ